MFIGFDVQTYGVLQDFPYERIVGCNSCKGIWLHHVLPFYVLQGVPCTLVEKVLFDLIFD